MRVLAFDQSYQCTGVALSNDGKLTWTRFIKMKGTNTEKRAMLRRAVVKLIEGNLPDFVTVERIRLFSGGFVAMPTIMSLGALNLTVVDAASPLKVFSIDTRSWKSRVVGSAKASKEDTVKFVRHLGFRVSNDDQADAACMAIYASRSDALLKLEK